LWRDEQTPQRERKRMVRLLIEDVTLIKAEQLTVQVRLRGGTARTLILPRPLPSWKSWQTDPELVSEIDRLLDEHTTGEIARQLNERGMRSGKGRTFTGKTIANICRAYRLKSRYDRLHDAGLLTRAEIAKELGIARSTVSAWLKYGLLKARLCGDRKEYLYEPLGEHRPVTCQGRKLSDPRRFEQLSSLKLQEV
jgi:DNA-binding transcriptional ArsR family regulator